MPFETKWEKHGHYSRFWGIVPEWEIQAMNREFSDDQRSDQSRYQIFDGTDIEAFEVSGRDITRIASNDIGLSYYLKNISVALISSKAEIKEAYQAYIEICQQFNTTWAFRIFDTLDEAREWIAPRIQNR